MSQHQTRSITGVYEVCIGVRQPIPQIQYWEQFGYRIGQVGELYSDSVQKLYDVNSGLRSIRLFHQDADHGLIRLMVWDNPVNEGLQMDSMKVSSRPGCLGLSLYTYRVHSLDTYFERVKASAARDVTAIVDNEFGEHSFSFAAPDGYVWKLIEG